MCLPQGHNAVTPVRLEPAALRSRVKHSTTEPLRSHVSKMHYNRTILFFFETGIKITVNVLLQFEEVNDTCISPITWIISYFYDDSHLSLSKQFF